MSARTRSLLLFAAKALVAAALIAWLVRSGHLDVGALAIVIEEPLLLAMTLGVFLLGACVGTLRFSVLLGLANVTAPLLTLFKLQLVGLFFNVVIPGNIGGDVVKALYVARDVERAKRTTIVLLAFVERLLGVAALVLVASLVTIFRPSIWSDPLLRPLAGAVAALGAATLVSGAAAIAIVQRAGPRLDAYTSGPSKIAKLLNRLVASLRLLASEPRRLVVALALSMTTHVAAMGLFTALTRAILERNVAFSQVATVFPLGLLTLMLPISPSGLGVGHVAFKRLFEAIGVAGGATVFNVYLLGQIAPCLVGVFPFLALKRRGELPTELDAPKAPSAGA